MRRIDFLGVMMLTIMTFSSFGQSAMEDKMGNETFEMIRSTMGFYDDEALLGFVTGVGKKLEAVMPENEYTFKYYLVDSQEPNAFATMGGYVYVTRGLLAIIDTEDELACVLGHEFTHVLEKHTNKKLKRHYVPAIMEIPGNLVGTLFSQKLGGLMNLPVELVAQPMGAAFDRKQENSADAGGIDLAMRAGYNPYALVSALSKLEDVLQFVGASDGKFSIMLDHPITTHRVNHINELLEGKETPDSEEATIYDHTRGLLIGENPSQGLILKDNKFIHPDLMLAVQLPEGWKVENTPAALRAMNKHKNAALAFGVNGDYKSAEEAGKAFKSKASESKWKVISEESKLINGYHAYETKVVSEGRGASVEVIVWVELLGINGVLQYVATGNNEEDIKKVNDAIHSLRPITDEEKKMVEKRTLHYAKGYGKTLEEFAKENNAEKNIKWMQLLNGSGKDEVPENEVLKYVKTESYY